MNRDTLEAHCRTAFASWDGYRGLGGVVRQHFTEEQREHWRRNFSQMEAATNPATEEGTQA